MAPELVAVYRKHFLEQTETLPCAAVVESFPKSLWKHWRERLYIERLEMRLDSLEKRLAVLQHDWEAFLISVARKLAPKREDLEALFFGQMGLQPKTNMGESYIAFFKGTVSASETQI